VQNPFENIHAVCREFDGVSDRAAAIVAAAFLDEILQELLSEFLVKDPKSDKKIFEGMGPLSTFNAKIELGFRLGLLSNWEHQTIHTVRAIRNEFAHVVDGISFDTQSIKDRCKNIVVPVSMVAPDLIPLSQSGEIPPPPTIVKADANEPRAIFQEVVSTLMHTLAARTADAGRAARTTPPDFSMAHEPAERLLLRLKNSLERYEDLLSQHNVIITDENAKCAKDVKRYRKMIHLQEFIIDRIKSAHASREE